MKAITWVPIALLVTALLALVPVAGAGESPLPSFEKPSKSGGSEEGVPRPTDLEAVSVGLPDRIEYLAEGRLEAYEVEGSTVLILWPTDSDFCVPGEVYNTQPPALSGTAAVGGTLSVGNGSWFICQAYPSYSYRWSTGATGQSYVVGSGDAGTTITATVTNCTRLLDGTPGDCASAASNAVSIPASPPPPPPPPPAPAPVVTFDPSAVTIGYGGTATFGWSASNATSCQASGGDVAWQGGRPTSGSYTTQLLTATTTYTLQCLGSGGTGTANLVVTVAGSQPAVTLGVAPQEVSGGGSVTLTWSSTNSSAGCTATSNPVFSSWNGVKPASGSQSVGPIFQPSSFTLSCESSTGGRDTKTVTVTVLGSPPPSPPYRAPFGALDRVDTSIGIFEGWACDPDDYGRGISVEFYRDGPAGQGGVYLGSVVAANVLSGSSIGSQCGGTTAHGFRAIFQTLLDGKQHTIYAYAVNIGTPGPNTLLAGTPRGFPGAQTCSGPVVLYDGAGFSGECWPFAAGHHPNLGGAGDRASSIKVADGWTVSLFADADFGGAPWTTRASNDSAAQWGEVGDDNASSMIIQQEDRLVIGEDLPPSQIEFKSNGCWYVWDGFSEYSQYGRRALTYSLSTRFCAQGSTVTRVDTRDIVVDIPPFPFPLNLVNRWQYTQAFFLEGEAGGRSTALKVQGTFEFCLFKYGCTVSYDRWIRIELRGDGTATCTSSRRPAAHNCNRRSA